MPFTELPGAAGLLLVPVIRTRSLGNRLPVRNLRLTVCDFYLIIVFNTPFKSTQMKLPLPRNDRLLQLFGLFHQPSRVFLMHPGQHFAQLLRFGFIHRLDGTAIFRFRILNEIKAEIASLFIQRISTAYVFQFDRSADITGYHLRHLMTDLPVNGKELRDALLRTAVGINQIVSLFHFSGENFKIRNLSDMRFQRRLKKEQAGRAFRIRIDFHAVNRHQPGHLVGTWHYIAEEFQRPPDTHILA